MFWRTKNEITEFAKNIFLQVINLSFRIFNLFQILKGF